MIDIRIDNIRGIPAPRPRLTKAGTAYNLSMYTDYKEFLQMKFRGFKMMPRVALKVELAFSFIPSKSANRNKYPVPKGDADNLAKGVLDAMNGVLIEDDILIADLRVLKVYAETESIVIRVEEL